jgi:hypothetical protein
MADGFATLTLEKSLWYHHLLLIYEHYHSLWDKERLGDPSSDSCYGQA